MTKGLPVRDQWLAAAAGGGLIREEWTRLPGLKALLDSGTIATLPDRGGWLRLELKK